MEELTRIINNNHGQSINNYEQLHNWSINHIPEFWEEVWNYCDIINSKPHTQVVDDVKVMPGAKWFAGTKLNFVCVPSKKPLPLKPPDPMAIID